MLPIKHTITYFIVNSSINIISKVVIKYLYEASIFSQKSYQYAYISHVPLSKLIRKCHNIINVVQQVLIFVHLTCEIL